ncbi:transcription termination factor NusA [Dialister pneumosintes]|uniref:Transcription termination/antitermination protein NusA n=1 Tax=Dialister pneumosintes TaxID=39950 RepID=A0ABX9MCE7_9FIRM|nr:transcription termination factor NusA [Dialister pneumosintes]MBS6480132.1 transcription termination/antitermination protein NusA [Dialister sp.]RID94822.1 transcription termination/antitermination protein NusA [Dialister pneumosintes]CDF26831.1 transcription termination factor NusA [Dialister sp. CAG:588]
MVQEKHNDELLQAVNALVKLKKVPENIVFDALEMVLLTAYKKEQGNGVKASISLDRETGKYKIYADKFVVADINPEDEDAINKITVEEAKKINPEYEEGAYIRIDVTPKDFGRTAAQTAKQVLIQKLREAERGSIFDEFSGREGDIITGTVKWSESKTIFVDLGRIEGILPSTEQIEGEFFEANQKIKCYILEVRKTTKGPEIILSRTHPGLLKRLFELEVPEIYSGTVEIKSVVREAGSRSKIAVCAMDPTIDSVGACVGPKGQRVQNIVNELHDEKIDIVRWDEDPAIYIANALSPSKVVSVSVWEEDKSSYVIVPDYQLSLAIGKAGQNARLAAKLTNWKIDIKSETQALEEGRISESISDENTGILSDIETIESFEGNV